MNRQPATSASWLRVNDTFDRPRQAFPYISPFFQLLLPILRLSILFLPSSALRSTLTCIQWTC